MKYYLVISTVPNQRIAAKISKQLLKEKLCACVNVTDGVKSYFWWKSKIDQAKEIILHIKTTQSKLKKLIARVEELHPYDAPEVISIEIKEANKKYLNWIDQNVR